MTLYKKGTPPIRDFPKTPPTFFKLNLKKAIVWLQSSFDIWIKKRFECFVDFVINIQLMKKASGFSLKTARLKEVLKAFHSTSASITSSSFFLGCSALFLFAMASPNF